MMMREDGLFSEASEFLSPAVAVWDVQPAMSEEGEVELRSQAMACANPTRKKRRSPRLVRKEELSACASEQDLILKLKKEAKALRDLQDERLTREARLVDGWLAVDTEYHTEASEPVIDGMKVEEETQPGGKRKRKKVVKSRVSLELIEYMILNRRRSPYEGICDDLEVGKRSQRFREKYAERMAIANKHYEYEEVLIKQYRTKGYADDYAEVTDNEEN